MIRSMLTPLALTAALAQGGCTLGLMQKDYISRAETIPVNAAPAGVGTLPVQAITPEDASSAEARSIAALLLPESAGRILRVREKHFSNGSRQEILIATDKSGAGGYRHGHAAKCCHG